MVAHTKDHVSSSNLLSEAVPRVEIASTLAFGTLYCMATAERPFTDDTYLRESEITDRNPGALRQSLF